MKLYLFPKSVRTGKPTMEFVGSAQASGGGNPVRWLGIYYGLKYANPKFAKYTGDGRDYNDLVKHRISPELFRALTREARNNRRPS